LSNEVRARYPIATRKQIEKALETADAAGRRYLSTLQRLRDSLTTKIKPGSVNRLFKGLKAALNFAARHEPRITNAHAWRVGIAALPDAHSARNVILGDEKVRALIAGPMPRMARSGSWTRLLPSQAHGCHNLRASRSPTYRTTGRTRAS
jgi:hypothetical protein